MPARRDRLYLLLAAAPAIAGSLILMRMAGVASAALALQAGAAACLALAAMMPARWSAPLATHARWLVPSLAAALFVPIALGNGAGPHRWISGAGVRLYLVPLLLPMVFRLARGSALDLAALVVAGVALLAQPDAAQATATACAAAVLVWFAQRATAMRVATLAVLWVSAVVAWQRPDPLTPVPHVEGVFLLAAGAGPAALAAAIAAAALPVATLAWLGATTREQGCLAVAVYYAALLAQAPMLVTPVPLLGYGAAPILGYAVMMAVSGHSAHDRAPRRLA